MGVIDRNKKIQPVVDSNINIPFDKNKIPVGVCLADSGISSFKKKNKYKEAISDILLSIEKITTQRYHGLRPHIIKDGPSEIQSIQKRVPKHAQLISLDINTVAFKGRGKYRILGFIDRETQVFKILEYCTEKTHKT